MNQTIRLDDTASFRVVASNVREMELVIDSRFLNIGILLENDKAAALVRQLVHQLGAKITWPGEEVGR